MFHKVKMVNPISDYRLSVQFAEGVTKIYDIKPLFEKWPGALTLLVKNNDWYKSVTGRETTAFRCPGDQWLRSVIELCGCPLYSTSVNVSGSAPLQDGQEILRQFGGQIALFVSDQKSAPSSQPPLASTLVSLLEDPPRVLRQGSVRI